MRVRISPGISERLALAALAVAPALDARWGALIAAAGLGALLAGRSRGAHRGQRAASALFVAATAAIGVAAAAWVAGARPDAAAASLQTSYEGFWEELGEDADRAAAALGAPPYADERRREGFESLRRMAVSPQASARTYLVFDPFGDLEVWWGPGLLVDLRAPVPPRELRAFSQAALSTTPYVVRRLPSPKGRDWTLVVGESFARDGSPPSRFADRSRWQVERWRLDPREGDDRPALRVSGVVEQSPRLEGRNLRALAGCLVALGLAVVAIRRGRERAPPADSIGDAGRWSAGEALVWAAAALFAAALALGCRPLPALAAGAAALGAGSALLLGSRGAPRAVRWIVGAGVGPALMWAAAELPGATPSLTAGLFGAPSDIVVRLTACLAVVGAWLWAAGATPAGEGRRSRATAARFAAAVLALGALGAADHAAAATALLAAAGGAMVLALGRPGRRTPASVLGLGVFASLFAGAAWTAGEQVAVARRATAALPRLLPPSADRLERLRAEVQLRLQESADLQLEDEAIVDRAPSDLAYAIWRGSPLARRDGLSSLSVVPPGGPAVSFSFGLPIDLDGRLDLSPVRWVDLVPSPWLDRRIEGDLARLRLDGTVWELRWVFVARPGFGEGGGTASGERFSDILSAGSRRGSLPDLAPGLDSVLFGADAQPLATPWMEGTPALRREWLGAPPFTQRVATPRGSARLVAASDGEVTAVVFRSESTALGALERAGNFAVGAWIVGLLAALPALALAHSPAAARTWALGLWGSYSKRLVVVFSVFLLLPLGGLYAFLAASTESRLRRDQETAALDALRSSQRVLGEYVLSLDPGFGIGTALDDRLLEWLARVVRSEIHLYWGSEIYASSKRDLFAAGLVPRRLAGEVWKAIHLDGDRVARRLGRFGPIEAQEIYAPLEIPGLSASATKLVLASPLLTQGEDLAAETARVQRRALLVTLALAALLAAAGVTLARRFARPIEAIVAGTRRIAEGAPGLGYRPDERELEALAEAIDTMAERIAEARERLMVEKGLVERIVENVTAGVVGLDREGRVLFANRLARTMLRATPGTVLLQTLESEGLSAARTALQLALGSTPPIATRVALGEGERDWTLVRVPLPGGTEPSELVVVEDVTDVVRAQRLDAWAAMARIIAHEVKNPLTPIRLSAEHLREAWARDREHFAAVFERCTSNILAQVEELRRTANEFSLFSEIPRIEPQTGDLRTAVAEVVEAYRAAPPPGVTIRLRMPDQPVELSFDRRLLGRAVRNLVENAVRASSDGGEVEVRVESAPTEVALTVCDSGPGVPPEILSRVVEPYFSTHSGGTGLGLPIARRVAEEHGGNLTVRNRPSGGFEVTLSIPRR